MADEKPLTKSEFISALKEADVVTKKSVHDSVSEEIAKQGLATKRDLSNELAEFHYEIEMPAIKKLITDFRKEMKNQFAKIHIKLNSLQGEVDNLKFDAPTSKEFEELKTKVYRHHLSN